MDNTNPGENLEKQVLQNDLTTETSNDESVTVSKSDWEKLQQTLSKHERLLKKQEGQTIDKEMVASVAELAFNQKVNKLASEANIQSDLAEQLFKLKPDFNKTDLENPIFKNLIDANKRQARVNSNTPGSNTSSQQQVQDLSKMTRAEKIQNFRNIMGVQ